MADIESLSLKPNATILSIGAVKFNMNGVYDSFYVNVVTDMNAEAFDIDPETQKWWSEQSDAARAVLLRDPQPIVTALAMFRKFLLGANSEDEVAGLWGNGSDFDNVVLNHAYNAMGMARPWSYKANRCYRTMKSLYPEIKADDRNGVHHNALDDAEYQAHHLIKIFDAMPYAPADFRKPGLPGDILCIDCGGSGINKCHCVRKVS